MRDNNDNKHTQNSHNKGYTTAMKSRRRCQGCCVLSTPSVVGVTINLLLVSHAPTSSIAYFSSSTSCSYRHRSTVQYRYGIRSTATRRHTGMFQADAGRSTFVEDPVDGAFSRLGSSGRSGSAVKGGRSSATTM